MISTFNRKQRDEKKATVERASQNIAAGMFGAHCMSY